MNSNSCECTKSEMDFFSMPPTLTTMTQGQWVEYYPLSTLDDHSPIEFDIKGNGEDYMDLAQTYLYVKGKITKADGTNLDGDLTKVGPVNNFMHSLFSEVDLTLNGKIVSSSTSLYPYRAYLENLMLQPRTKTSQLDARTVWAKDSAQKFDKPDPTADPGPHLNTGLKARHHVVADSRVFEMMDKLHLDMVSQEKLLLNGVDVRLRFNRTKPEFCLMAAEAGGQFKIQILQAILYVRKVKPQPSHANTIAKQLAQTPAKYPIRRVEVKTFTIPNGTRSVIEDNLFQGQLPKRIILGLTSNTAVNGSLHANPFNFSHRNVSKIEVVPENQPINSRPFEPNFDSPRGWIRDYLSLFQCLDKIGGDYGLDITLTDYPHGYCLWGFDFTPDQGADGDLFHPIQQGNVRVEIQFKQAIQEALNVVVYAEFDNCIEITHSREVMTDF